MGKRSAENDSQVSFIPFTLTESSMINTSFNFSPVVIAAALVFSTTASFATMDDATYKASKKQIEVEYKQDKATCSQLSGNAKDVCHEKAEAKEKVAEAELTANHSGKPADSIKVAKVRADTEYDVSKEMCDDSAGNTKDVCVKEAKAKHVKALADIKANEKVSDATSDANADKRDADYQLAAEKCNSLAGDSKDTCMKAAKTRYGKS